MSHDIDGATDRLTLPLIPLRNGVVFPATVATLPIGRARSVELVKMLHEGDIIGLALQRDPQQDEPDQADLLPVGVHARVDKIVKVRAEQYRLVVEALGRFELLELTQREPYFRAEVQPVAERSDGDLDAQARAAALVERLERLGAAVSKGLRDRLRVLSPQQQPGQIADVVAASLGMTSDKEGEILLLVDVDERLQRVHGLLDEMELMTDVRRRIEQEVRQGLGDQQRKMMLRQQLKAIQKELGDDDDALGKLKSTLEGLELPDEARQLVERELRRLDEMGGAQMESHVIRRYLELIAELPWSERAEVVDRIDDVAAKLDADHFGLDDVKKRIQEHIAVRKVTGNNRGAILCLVGPPGVGKTSLGQSVADATGRPFVRTSLGGVRDEAEIRGHRRTYVGALPGRILNALRKAKVKNPVLMLDEIDKLGHGWQGSPESALLEVLDPEQNHSFTDHYLELPFDLSEVLFICTANTLETVSPPLRDRLDVVEIQGYTTEEKREIARRHLIPKQLDEHGLQPELLQLDDVALHAVISDYTREAGVRQLQRELAKICRRITLEVARSDEGKLQIAPVTADGLRNYLGKQRFYNDADERTAIPGVAMGLAWTPVGGDVLFVETSRMPGKGKLEITGQLGDVMKESAQAALTYIRSHADALGVDAGFLEKQDVHIHVPSGAIPKDGPSAGVTIFTALTSLLTGRQARADTAMTGECTLRGRVLPVGGIKAKVLAAHRHGLTRIILPQKNQRDLDDVPVAVQQEMEFVFATEMSEVLAAALELGESLGSSATVDVEASPAIEAA